MKIQTFYYEKETVISFVLPKNKQHNSYHNNSAKKVKHDLEIEIWHQMDAPILNAIRKTNFGKNLNLK